MVLLGRYLLIYFFTYWSINLLLFDITTLILFFSVAVVPLRWAHLSSLWVRFFWLSSLDGSLDCEQHRGTGLCLWELPLMTVLTSLWLGRRVKEEDTLRALQLLVPLFNPAYLSIPPWSYCQTSWARVLWAVGAKRHEQHRETHMEKPVPLQCFLCHLLRTYHGHLFPAETWLFSVACSFCHSFCVRVTVSLTCLWDLQVSVGSQL